MDDQTATPAPQKAGLVEDFIDIFASPAKVFARRVNANAVVPWLIVSVVLIALFFASRNALQPIYDGEMARGVEQAMKQNPKLTPEVMEQSKGMMATIATVSVLAGIPIGLLGLGLVTWGVGKVLGGKLTYTTALNIAAFAWVPRIVDSVLKMVESLVLDVSKMTAATQISFSPARFIDPATMSPGLLNLLGRVDLITIWVTLLLTVGVIAAGKVDRKKGVLAVVLFFVIGALPQIFGALRG
jgi:hypothetical protein